MNVFSTNPYPMYSQPNNYYQMTGVRLTINVVVVYRPLGEVVRVRLICGCCPLMEGGYGSLSGPVMARCCLVSPLLSCFKRAITARSSTFYAFLRAPPCEHVLLAISYIDSLSLHRFQFKQLFYSILHSS